MSAEEDADIAKLRRFTLLVALALFIYSVSGAKLDLEGDFRPLGIPLKIDRPDLLGYGLEAVSVYATLRYCLLAHILAESPIKARRRLRQGRLASWRGRHSLSGPAFLDHFEGDLQQYYPRFGNYVVCPSRNLFDGVQPESYRTEPPTIPFPIRAIGQIHNFDYWLPVLANLVALGAHVLKQVCLI